MRGIRPMVDGGSPTVALGVRETQQGTVTYGTAASLTGAGMAPVLGSGRYFRAKVTVPAASTWSNALGVDDLEFRTAGRQ